MTCPGKKNINTGPGLALPTVLPTVKSVRARPRQKGAVQRGFRKKRLTSTSRFLITASIVRKKQYGFRNAFKTRLVKRFFRAAVLLRMKFKVFQRNRPENR